MAWLASASLLALLAPAPAAPADSARDTVYVLPGVSVEERRLVLERDLSLRPGFAALYVVDALPSPTTTASEVLSDAVGVHVRQFGGLGAFSAVSVRGANANQVAFYLDGVPLVQAQYGVINPADLPLAALDHVEVYRGTAPLALANPGAGVVNLVTRRAPGGRASARAGYGSFDTRRAEAWGIWAGGRARLFGACQLAASRGNFVFLDDNGTPFNPADDERVRRANDTFASQGVTVKLDLPLGARAAPAEKDAAAGRGSLGLLTAAADLFAKCSGMPGISSFQSAHARLRTERGVGSLTWASPAWLGRALELETRAYAVGARDRLADLGNELGGGRQDTDDRTASWGVRQRAALAGGPLGQSLELVAEARREEFAPGVVSPQPWTGPRSRRDVVSLGAEERLDPWKGKIVLTGSVRRESAFDDFPRGPSYSGSLVRPAVSRSTRYTVGGAGLRVGLGGGLVLRANAGRAERLPSLFELFGDRGAAVGNRSLVPERLDNRDVGLAWSLGRGAGSASGAPMELAAEVACYRTDARDLIVFLQNAQQVSVPLNVSAARLTGVESSLAARRGALRLAANWTYQDARDRSGIPYWNGRQLPGRPAHEVFTRLEYEAARWRLFHEFHYVSSNFLDRSGRAPVAARQLHNLGAGAAVMRGALRLTAEIRNLTDNRVQDVANYPLPGRSCAVTAEVRFP